MAPLDSSPAEPPSAAAAPCIFVIGMHRSGTSASAGMLASLGLAAPWRGDRMARTKWNERGNFESRRLAELNDRLLLSLGGSWSGPPALRSGWEADRSLAPLRAEAVSSFGQSFPRRPMVWKDPRNCLTLPFWRSIVAPPSAAVFVYRHPLEVARSLQARDGSGVIYGIALWDRYLRSASAGLVGLPTMVMDYARILNEPSASLGELVDFLVSIGLDIGSDEASRQSALASLDGGLRHQQGAADERSDLWPSQLANFELLRSLDGPHQSWTAPDLGPEPDWVEEILTLKRSEDELGRFQQMFHHLRPLRTSRIVWDLRRRARAAAPAPEAE